LGTKSKITAQFSADIWSENEKVTPAEKETLTTPFTLEEIHHAVFQMDPNKAPGIDDFSMLFYQIFGTTLKMISC
jgi:hypothetical protein